MNVTAIEMKPAEAERKLTAYREFLAKRHNEEFDAVAAAYKELAKGTPLIDAGEAIRACGWRADGRPVLAIARADQKRVSWQVGRHSRQWTKEGMTGNWAPMEWAFTATRIRNDRQRSANLRFVVPDVKTEPPVHPTRGTAMVPLVPPEAYPARGLDLSKHFVLWEVESWDYAPPIDPMLLRHIGGNLWAVVAQWDLTEIERTVIAGTRRE
jgi:hypothetical protein